MPFYSKERSEKWKFLEDIGMYWDKKEQKWWSHMDQRLYEDEKLVIVQFYTDSGDNGWDGEIVLYDTEEIYRSTD